MHASRSLQLIAALVVVGTISSAGAQVRNWTIHNYPADGFSIALPADPQVHTEKDPAGPSMSSYSIDLGQGELMVGVGQFGSLVASKSPDAILQDGKNGSLAQSKTHLVSEKKITIDSSPGLEFEAENETIHIRARVYLVGSTAYQLVEGYPIGKPFDHATEFFDSFRLIGRRPTPSQQ